MPAGRPREFHDLAHIKERARDRARYKNKKRKKEIAESNRRYQARLTLEQKAIASEKIARRRELDEKFMQRELRRRGLQELSVVSMQELRKPIFKFRFHGHTTLELWEDSK